MNEKILDKAKKKIKKNFVILLNITQNLEKPLQIK